jgi:hypothetical protein
MFHLPAGAVAAGAPGATLHFGFGAVLAPVDGFSFIFTFGKSFSRRLITSSSRSSLSLAIAAFGDQGEQHNNWNHLMHGQPPQSRLHHI